MAEAVQLEVARQMEHLSRDQVIAASLSNRAVLWITQDLAEAAAR
ncbi:MAG: hypothetical protein R3C44_16885 [Chloroflexota bacterium]